MKFLAAVLVLVSTNVFAYTPDFDISVLTPNAVTLEIANDTDSPIVCDYRMSWFENAITFKRFTGKLTVVARDLNNVSVEKDIAAKVTFLKARVDCQ